jgi:hypothetical protein
MILYDLRCKSGHEFEAWFRDSSAYDKQRRASAVLCPVCGDKRVEKALMAPAVAKKGNSGEAPAAPPAPAPTAGEVSPEAAKMAAAMQMLRHLRQQVEANCDYVGPKFADEARRIHYKEAEARNIYGEATKKESEALEEEGIEFGQIPWLPTRDS